MANPYYAPTGWPATSSTGTSAPARAELAAIEDGFDLLPAFSSNGSKAVIVNAGATALTVTTGTLALAGNLATTGAFNTTFVQGATVSITLPTVTGLTLATISGTETLTNKTLTSPALTSPTITGVTSIPDGTAAAPSLKVGDEQNGLFSPGANILGLGVGGTEYVRLQAGTVGINTAGDTGYALDIVSAAAGDIVLRTRGTTSQSAVIQEWANVGGSVLMSVTAAGILNLVTGQIAFPATANASGDANTLDDYEEGTWTPDDQSGATLTFTSVVADYEKIGRQVTARFTLTYPSTADATANSIGGLPFTVSNTTAQRQGFMSVSDEATALRCSAVPNATTLDIRDSTNNVIANSAMSTNFAIGTVIYHV